MLAYCLDCSTAYAIDLAACPHCKSDRKNGTPPPVRPQAATARGTEVHTSRRRP